MKFVLALLSTALLATPNSQARLNPSGPDSCRFVRLDSRGGSMEHVPVRTQGTLGVAFAEAAAQLADAWRFSHGERNTQAATSSVATALAYGEQLKRERLSSGTACPSPTTLTSANHCAQFKLVEAAIAKGGLRNFMRRLEGYFTSYRYDARKDERVAQLLRKRHPAQLEKLNGNRENRLESVSRVVLSFLRSSGFSPAMTPSPNEVRALLEQPDSKIYFENLLKHASAACSPKSAIAAVPSAHCNFIAVSAQTSNKVKLATEIRRRLAEPHAQPVGIAYCSQVLHKGRHYRGLASQRPRCYGKDDHLSLVIGMRPGFSQGSCQLLVRNSHGTNCDSYSRDWECERGNIWVDSRALLENTKAISSLEPITH